MLFNSLQFLVFFIVVTALYYILQYRYRWMLLLAASCYFYMAFVPIYILILGFTIVVDYFAGIFIEKSEGKRRKLFLLCSLIANIGVLAVFKYYNFLNDNLTHLLGSFDFSNPIPALKILLPIGLSFHTFQAMSYTIEVYRGKQKSERHFGIYSLYVMFYPQLVTGPIERPQNLLPQLKTEHTFNYDTFTSGLRLMAWGLFKKVVIADRLAILVDHVYDNPHHYSGISLLIATVFFTYQIYCDFSGYTDIAIGAARVMGINLMQNFRNPFQAKSMAEFWRRWHISLSTWFRDYLYIPMGGNRVKLPRHIFNLFIVFLIGGLWHGANWTYILWGALHGFYLVFALLTQKPREKLASALGIQRFAFLPMLTVFLLVAYACIFFRAGSISDAFYIGTHIFNSVPEFFHLHHLQNMGVTNAYLVFSCLLILFIEAVQFMDENYSLFTRFLEKPRYIRWSFYYVALFVIGVYGIFEHRQFIYFQF